MIPALALGAVLQLRSAPSLVEVLPLLLASVGTSAQAGRAIHAIGLEVASAPERREGLLARAQLDVLAWGTLATAAWAGLFARLLI